MAKSIQQIINEQLEVVYQNEDQQLIHEFDRLYSTLDDSYKSNLVRILIGKGAIKKEKDGSLTKDKEAGEKIKKSIGIK